MMLVAVGTVICPAVQAASFDCEQASTSTEKAICADETLGILDDKMAKYYALAQANDPEQTLLPDQRVWLKERNTCKADNECISASYWLRIATLMPYVKPQKYHPVALVTQERDKLPYLQEVLGTREFFPRGEVSGSALCRDRFDALLQGDIEMVEPDVKADRYFAPELAPYRARCPNLYLNETNACAPQFFRGRIHAADAMPWDQMSYEEQRTEQRHGGHCGTYFGTTHFRIYTLPGTLWDGDGVIYYREGMYGKMNHFHVDSLEKRANYAPGLGGYRSLDLKSCYRDLENVHPFRAPRTKDPVPSFHYPDELELNISAIYQWRDDYYVFSLVQNGGKRRKPTDPPDFRFSLHRISNRIAPIDGCGWSTLERRNRSQHSKPSTQTEQGQ